MRLRSLRICHTFFFNLHLTSQQANHFLFMSSYHNQTNARFLCRASAFAHLIKLSPFLASGWIKELFGRQRLHHDWRQHSRCFNCCPALVLWRWMRTYQELYCLCQVWTDRWRLWWEMHGDENSKLSPLIDNRCRCNEALPKMWLLWRNITPKKSTFQLFV